MAMLAFVVAGCGLVGGDDPPPTTTTTTPPPVLTVEPAAAPISTIINLVVTNAPPGETITFSITSPSGKVFNGSPHVVDPGGTTSATYNTTGDEVGAHTVKAVGSGGTSLTGTFTLSRF